MNENMIWEIIGYCGSALVLVSLLMSSVVKLRIINTIGSLIFCVYAFQIHSIPTALMNLALVFINLYFLAKLVFAKKSYHQLPITPEDSALRQILVLYEKDIERYFGTVDLKEADVLLAVYNQATLAGIFAGKAKGDSVEILLDYTTPAFRDCSVARYLYAELAKKYRRLIYTGSNEAHIQFTQKMGYTEQNGKQVLLLEAKPGK